MLLGAAGKTSQKSRRPMTCGGSGGCQDRIQNFYRQWYPLVHSHGKWPIYKWITYLKW